MIQLHDIENKKLLGSGESVCYACHKGEGITKDTILCGLDGKLEQELTGGGGEPLPYEAGIKGRGGVDPRPNIYGSGRVMLR